MIYFITFDFILIVLIKLFILMESNKTKYKIMISSVVYLKHAYGKGQFSFQSQRKAMPKNAQTTAQLHSSHTLVKYCSKFSKPGFSNM